MIPIAYTKFSGVKSEAYWGFASTNLTYTQAFAQTSGGVASQSDGTVESVNTKYTFPLYIGNEIEVYWNSFFVDDTNGATAYYQWLLLPDGIPNFPLYTKSIQPPYGNYQTLTLTFAVDETAVDVDGKKYTFYKRLFKGSLTNYSFKTT